MMKAAALALLMLLPAPAAAAPVLRVDARDPSPTPVSPFTTGTTQSFAAPDGAVPAVWDAFAARPNGAVVDAARVAGVRLLRFPGGVEAGRYDWQAGLGSQRAACQYSGRDGGPALANVYGFDEHMRVAEAVGAQVAVTVPFGSTSAQSAADWVEYANALADGSNPGGGVDWAAVRAANGHPAPYGITRWAIGSDPGAGRSWLSPNVDRARRQYVAGGVHSAVDEPADADCRWGPPTSGLAGQVFRTRYAPVSPSRFLLAVGDATWTRVTDLATAAPNAPVYTLDEATGTLRFGDGTHGRVPPGGRTIGIDYRTARLPGYQQFRAAMTAIDAGIRVCASWADAAFLRAARAAGRTVDCVAAQPITRLSDYGNLLYNPGHYDAAVKGAARAASRVARLRAQARRLPGAPPIVVGDYGDVAGGARLENGSTRSMIGAIGAASQVLSWLRLGLPWATGGRLTDAPSALVDAAGGLSPAGQGLRPLAALEGTPVRAAVSGNPRTHGYPALRAAALETAAGELVLLVVNRDPRRPRTLELDLEGYAAAPSAGLAQTTSADLDSPLADYAEREVEPATGLTLPPHSITRLTLRPAPATASG